jgi:hypothetical protein
MTTLLNPLPLPTSTTLVTADRMMDWFWVQYFNNRDQRIESTASTVTTTAVSTQSASIAATPIDVGTAAGIYRLSIYARLTQAATTSSSLMVTIGWTDGTVSVSKAYAALVANTVTTVLAETLPVQIDANASLTYATTYASVGGTPMIYRLAIAAERVT